MKTIMDILTPSNIQFMIFTGAKYSLLLAIGALFFGVILGIIGAALKLSKHFVLRAIGNVYVEIFRYYRLCSYTWQYLLLFSLLQDKDSRLIHMYVV